MRTTTTTATTANHSERGAGLVVLLALLTLMTITLLALAPIVQQQVQRDKELEQIRRGEEVAQAIRVYVSVNNGKLPTSMDDLLEGIPQGTRKRQILRPSAAIDLLSEDGKWRLVPVNSPSLRNFGRRVQLYFNGILPSNPEPQRIFDQYSIAALVNVLDTESEDDVSGSAEDTDETTEDATDNVPFIGVVSGSKSKSVIAYYGIENHSKWLFTPLFRGNGVRTITGKQPNTGLEAEGSGGKQDIRIIR